MDTTQVIPPLPEGFILDKGDSAIPSLPKGFVLDSQMRTVLTPEQERKFWDWNNARAENLGISPDADDPSQFYDLRGAWLDSVQKTGKEPPTTGHLPDTFKLPGHPTFSIESKYYKPGMKAGIWMGDKYVPTGGAPGAELVTAPEPSLFQKVKDYLGIGVKAKTTPLDLEALRTGKRPYDIREEVFGTGKEEELRRIAGKFTSGITAGVTDLMKGYEEDPETTLGTIGGSAAELSGFILGPWKAASEITGSWFKPTADGLRAVRTILARSGATLGIAGGISRIIPSLIENDNFSKMAKDVFENTGMSGLAGIIYPGTGVIPTKPLRMAVTLALLDKLRAGTKKWFTFSDVLRGIKDGTIDRKELAERSFGYLMDLYFSSTVPSMKAQMKNVAANAGKDIVDEMTKMNPEEIEETILEVRKPGTETEVSLETKLFANLRPAIREGETVIAGKEGETHPDIMAREGIEKTPTTERGFATPEGEFLTREEAKAWMQENQPEVFKKWQALTKTDELHSEDYAKAVEEIKPEEPEKLIKKVRAWKGFDPKTDTLSAWVKKQGGIDYQREALKGELDRIREQDGGRFLVNKKGRGKTLDELAEAAQEVGFLGPEESINDLLDLLETDLTSKTTGRKIYAQAKEFFPEKEFGEGLEDFYRGELLRQSPEEAAKLSEEEFNDLIGVIKDEGIDEGTIREFIETRKEAIRGEIDAKVEGKGYPAEDIKATADELGDWFEAQARKAKKKFRFTIREPKPEGVTLQTVVIPGAKEFVEHDIIPKTQQLGRGLADTWEAFKHLIAPRIGVSKTVLDTIMAMKGMRDKAEFVLEKTTESVEKEIDKWTRDEQVNFIDRMKRGEPQENPRKQQMADMIRAMDDGLGEELKKRKPNMSWIENHLRVLYKVIPGTKRTGFMGIFRRPLRGGMGYFKKHTLVDLSEGLALGGEPHTYNPMRMFRLHHADAQKFITAYDMWERLEDLGAREFVRRGQRPPDGFVRLDDRIARVYVPVEKYGRYVSTEAYRESKSETIKTLKETMKKVGEPVTGEEPTRAQKLMEAQAMEALQSRGRSENEARIIIDKIKTAPVDQRETIIERETEKTITQMAILEKTTEFKAGKGFVDVGEWYVEEGAARLLNNFLSHDLIRECALGRGMMWIKNSTTAMELSLNAFHGMFESIEAISSGAGWGARKLLSHGILKGNLEAITEGIQDIAKSPGAFIEAARIGSSVIKYIANKAEFLKTAEGSDFIKKYPNADETIDALFTGGGRLAMHEDYKIRSLQTFKEAISANNYIGALLRSAPAANELLMKPLFEIYIPRLKVGRFFVEYGDELKYQANKIAAGKLTKEELARNVWDYVENRFGEMNFDNLFWNRTFKTALQLVIRSVTWKYGNLKLYGKGIVGQAQEFTDAFKERRMPEMTMEMAWMWGVAAVNAVISSIIQYACIQEFPDRLMDFVYPRIDKEGHRLSIPTYAKDLFSLVHSGVKYLESSEAGWIGRWGDVIKNKDFYGVQVHDPEDTFIQQRVEDLIHLVPIPFGISSYFRLREQGEPVGKALMSFIGFQKAPYYIEQSSAEQLAGELLQEAMIQKPRTEEEFERSKLVKKYAKDLNDAIKDRQPLEEIAGHIADDVRNEKLYMSDIKRIGDRLREPLEGKVKKLRVEDCLKVWDKADLEEREKLIDIIIGKIQRMREPEEKERLKPKIEKFASDVDKLMGRQPAAPAARELPELEAGYGT